MNKICRHSEAILGAKRKGLKVNLIHFKKRINYCDLKRLFIIREGNIRNNNINLHSLLAQGWDVGELRNSSSQAYACFISSNAFLSQSHRTQIEYVMTISAYSQG